MAAQAFFEFPQESRRSSMAEPLIRAWFYKIESSMGGGGGHASWGARHGCGGGGGGGGRVHWDAPGGGGGGGGGGGMGRNVTRVLAGGG